MMARLEATQKDDYPITVQTGHSVAELILSPERIDYTGSEAPEHVLLLSDHGVARLRLRLEKLPATSVIYAEEDLVLPETRAKVLRLPFAATAKKIGRLALAFVGLGALLERSRLYPLSALEKAITTFQSAKIAEVNVKAVTAGAELGRAGAS
jgi:Pyruvate/2-oxoacid:ferredoxin oxidoreductase gamma subunit